MHKYCLDTSGISNPVMELPETIHVSLWSKVVDLIHARVFCWNYEIGEELQSIPGVAGDALKSCNGECCFEISVGDWDWNGYLKRVEDWRTTYHDYISEYNGGRKNTIGLNDLSIVAFAKTLERPVVSMEKRNLGPPSQTRMRIPDLCDKESVQHLTFNEFLAAEGVTA
ncbi:MAG: DUF4411 family protein [Alphaproteobacteria bacterium]|nr:DUF4411 family protein [Alphaproteobacteria bacterium]